MTIHNKSCLIIMMIMRAPRDSAPALLVVKLMGGSK